MWRGLKTSTSEGHRTGHEQCSKAGRTGMSQGRVYGSTAGARALFSIKKYSGGVRVRRGF